MAKNPFDIFIAAEKTVLIKGLDAEITFRELTMAEADGFNKRLLKDYNGKGDPTIDLAEATKINYEKIAMSLIKPKISVEELEALGVTATKTIAEIVKVIDGRGDDVDDKGNLED